MKTNLPLILLLILYYSPVFAQCTAQGPRSAGTIVNDNSIGVYAFSNPTNASTSNDNRATASAVIGLLTGNTHYLKCSNFGFSIPVNASICGIEVAIEKSGAGFNILTSIIDNEVSLIKGGSIVGQNKANAAQWPETENYYTYGGDADLWGTSWTATEINSHEFGIAFSAAISGLLGIYPSARVDHIRITIHYLEPLPVSFLDFKAEYTDNRVLLEWQTIENDEAVDFHVMRSDDGQVWHQIGQVEGRMDPGTLHYFLPDPAVKPGQAYYYRVDIERISGRRQTSRTRKVQVPAIPGMRIWPNPARDRIQVSGLAGAMPQILSPTGTRIPIVQTFLGNDTWELSLNTLQNGVYLVFGGGECARLLVLR